MSFPWPRIVETQDGVYQPPLPLRLEAALFATLLLVIATTHLIPSRSPAYAWPYLALSLAWFVSGLYRHLKFGSLGQPLIAVTGDALVLARPNDSRGALRFARQDLRQLVVYGLVGRRTYRFMRHDGTHVEVTPLWGRSVEQAALRLLQRALPNQVTVEEPQTLFASVRGDGPAGESSGS